MWDVYTFDSVLVYDPHKQAIDVTLNKRYAIIATALFKMHNIYIQSPRFNLNE